MSGNEKTLKQRIEEYNEFYMYYSEDKDYPLLSIKPNEKVLVLISEPNRAYAFSKGSTVIVGIDDGRTGTEIPICAVRVVEATEGMMAMDDAVNMFSNYGYSRVLYDKQIADKEKQSYLFLGKLLEGVNLEDALNRWGSIKDKVTQEEIDEYELSLIRKVEDI